MFHSQVYDRFENQVNGNIRLENVRIHCKVLW